MRKMMPVLIIGVMFALVLFAGWRMYRWQYDTADRVLQEWASEQQLVVLDKTDATPIGSGPGNRYASNKQVVFRIKVKDRQGQVRHGLATIGSKSMGTLETKIEVVFDP